MKKYLLFSLIFTLLSLSSCVINEEVYFKENGEIEYATIIDMSNMSEFLPAEELEDMQNLKDLKHGEFVAWEDLLRSSAPDKEAKDSIETYIKDNRQSFDKLKPMKMMFDFRDKKMEVGYAIHSKSLKDFPDDLAIVNKTINELSSENSEFSKIKNLFNIIEFSFDGKKFVRNETANNWNALMDDPDSELQSESLLDLFEIKFKYRFDKPIKSTNMEDATFSSDRKTMYLSTDLENVQENPKKYNFEVQF